MSTKKPKKKKTSSNHKTAKTNAKKSKKNSEVTPAKDWKEKEEREAIRVERMPIKTRPKKKKQKETPPKEEKTKKPSKTIPKEWKEETRGPKKTKKKERKSLITTLKRSISIRKPMEEEKDKLTEPMNLVIILNPAKHRDIIEYIEKNVSSGGRAEWVRDSIRLKMRIEEGVYGLNAAGQDTAQQRGTEEMMKNVFGQFAETMTKVMTDIRRDQAIREPAAPARPRPIARPERIDREGPPQLKKIESKTTADMKPERPALDDAISAIIVVE